MYLLYHNPRCSKSRSCSKILNEKKINFKEILYLKDGLPFSSLNEILDKLINPLSDIIRVNEKEFKEDQFDFYKKELVINFLHKHPKCLQRPLFFNGHNYIICRPPEIVLKYIRKEK
tara:strand:+ start:3278 stop:3628 length:351 start_codon:yes stop_codon:yes gene_type:complete